MSDEAEFRDISIIGLTLDQAVERAKLSGVTVRVTQIDGQACIVTRDYRIDRLNVAIIDGVVAEVVGRG